MNAAIKQFARNELKEKLPLLPDNMQEFFKLLYGRNGGKRSVEDAKKMSIAEVVDKMEDEKLDWAMTQMQNSFDKVAKRGY